MTSSFTLKLVSLSAKYLTTLSFLPRKAEVIIDMKLII